MESLFCSNEREENVFPHLHCICWKSPKKISSRWYGNWLSPQELWKTSGAFGSKCLGFHECFSLTKYSQINATKTVLVKRRPSHTALSGFCFASEHLEDTDQALKSLRHSLFSGFNFYLVVLPKRHALREMLYKILNTICPERDSSIAPPGKKYLESSL